MSLFSLEELNDLDAPTVDRTTNVLDENYLWAVVNRIKKAGIVAHDIETTGLDVNAKMVGAGFAWKEMDYSFPKPKEVLCSVYVPVGHITQTEQLPLGVLKKAMQEIADHCQVWVYNASYELKEWRKLGVDIPNFHDVRYDAVQADEANTRKGLKANAEEELGMKWGTVEEIATKKVKLRNDKGKLVTKKVFDVASATITELGDYCRKDCEATYLLKEKYASRVRHASIIIQLESKVTPVVVDMESRGIRLDIPAVKKRLERGDRKLERIRSQIYHAAGKVINLNSPKQISELLFDELGLKPIKDRSTDVTVLQELKSEHEICAYMLEYREEEKIRGYLQAFLDKSYNERLYTSFNQLGAATGRFTSSGPNLQNVPSSLGIRELFIPSEGMLFGDYDYSQIEGRGFAHITGDPVLVEYYRNGGDIHTATAEKMGIDRRLAKTCNFAIIYGCYPRKLSQVMVSEGFNYDPRQAKEFIAAFWDVYRVAKQWKDRLLEGVASRLYSETLFGRRRRFPDYNTCDDVDRFSMQREAISHAVQGSCADIMKFAMVNVREALQMLGNPAYPLLTVHDELLFEGYPEQMELWDTVIRHRMEDAVTLSVPIIAEGRTGKNWAEVH